MVTRLKWSGDDSGGFDYEVQRFGASILYQKDGYNPSLRLSDGSVANFIGVSELGDTTQLSIRFLFKLYAQGSGQADLISPQNSLGEISWRLRVTTIGGFVLIDANNTARAWSSEVPLNQWVRVELTTDTDPDTSTGTLTLKVFDSPTSMVEIGDTTIMSAAAMRTVDNFRMGITLAGPTIDWGFDDILVADSDPVDPWLGPVSPPSADPGHPSIAIIGDSLTSMSQTHGAYLYDELTNRGFSTRNVMLWGVGGKKLTAPDITGKTTLNNLTDFSIPFDDQLDVVLIALGTNDRPDSDIVINANLDTVLSALEPETKLIWIGLTSKESASVEDIRVNNLIKTKVEARPNSIFADWDTHIRAIDGGSNPSPYWLTTDSTHMSPDGYSIRAEYYVDQLEAILSEGRQSIYIGSDKLKNIYIGDTPIKEAYVGSKLIWSSN